MKFFKVFVLVCTMYFVLCTNVNAQIPPDYIPCNKTADPEFHSLRPYQASPCSSEVVPYASFCGNKLTLKEVVPATYPGGGGICKQESGKVVCKFNIPVPPHKVIIDLTSANLPIMGNTEEVTNYKGEADQLTDAQKVNEYVSWYLNGVINRAEYSPLDVSKNCIGETSQRAGMCLNTLPVIGTCLSPNPIPLLPDIPNPLLKADGVNSCGGGTKSCCVTINPLARKVDILDRDKLINYSGPINKLLPQEVQQQYRANTINNAKISRHDQIVGCTYGLPTLFWGQVGAIPGPCYFESGIINTITELLKIKVSHRLSDWADHMPPVRSKFDSYAKYYKKYQEWRGKECKEITIPDKFLGINIPIIGGMGVMYCYNDLGSPDFYSNLYQYIPLSSTEDLEGNIKVDSFSSASGDSVKNITFNNQTPATLSFSHLEESDQLGSILQDTYVGKGEAKTGPDVAVEPPSSCTTVDVRSNKGDSLFAKSLSGDLGYTASFTCSFNPPSCKISPLVGGGEMCKSGPGGKCTCTSSASMSRKCPSGYTCGQKCSCEEPIQTCNKTVYIALSTTSKTPKIDDVWSRLVAGPTAIVKRMFPKLGTQIGTLKDMPGSTSITYSGSGVQSSGELNLPHVGGISEYFLKGIQTMLRPKGYGEKITFGKVDNGQENLDQCKYTMAQINTAMQQAAKKYQVPESLLRAIFEIEAAEFLLNPDSYICKENAATAAGPMQITRGAYQYVTCENERYEKDADSNGGICKSEGDKLSRCDINDNFELAARTLLWKAGKIADCNATGPMPTDKMSIYNAACKYYGSFAPDALTINYAKGIPASERRQNGNMNYCDIVCHKMGTCPPYP